MATTLKLKLVALSAFLCGNSLAQSRQDDIVRALRTKSLSIPGQGALSFRPIFQLDFPAEITTFCWSQDSQKLAVASTYGNRLALYDRTGKRLGSISRNGLDIQPSIATLPKSNEIVFAPSEGSQDGFFLTVWDVVGGRNAFSLSGPGLATVFDLSPDGSRLLVKRGRREVDLYDALNWRVLKSLSVPASMGALKFFPDGRRFVMGSAWGDLYLAGESQSKPEKIASLFQHQFPSGLSTRGNISSISVSPDGARLLVGVGLQSVGAKGEVASKDDMNRAFSWIANSSTVSIVNTQRPFKQVEIPLSPGRSIESTTWDPKDRMLGFTDDDGRGFILSSRSSGYQTYLSFKGDTRFVRMSISPDGGSLAVTDGRRLETYKIVQSENK